MPPIFRKIFHLKTTNTPPYYAIDIAHPTLQKRYSYKCTSHKIQQKRQGLPPCLAFVLLHSLGIPLNVNRYIRIVLSGICM